MNSSVHLACIFVSRPSLSWFFISRKRIIRLSKSSLSNASASFYPIYIDKNCPFRFSIYSVVWPSISRKQAANISCRNLGIQLHIPFSVQEAKTAAPLLRQLFFFIQQHLVSQNPKPALAKHTFPNKKRRTPRHLTTPAVLLLITVPVRHAICAPPTKAHPFRRKCHVYIIGNTYFW